jgi:hypothetical protein
MLNKYIKIVLIAALSFGLSACGKTDEEKRYEQAVKAQALGCITTEQALNHKINYDSNIDHEIKVCLKEESNRKNDIHRQQRHEQTMAYYEAEMLDELDDISENLAYTHSRPISPIEPGEYYSRVGDSDCGYWIAGRWEWYDEDSRCAVQNRRYYDYMVITGAITASELYRVRNYSYHDNWKRSSHYKPVLKVNNYYSSTGKVVDFNTYKTQRNSYTTQRNSWESSRKKYRQSESYKKAYNTASTKDTKFNPTIVKNKTNDVKSGKFQASEKPKKFVSNFATSKNQTANNATVNKIVKDTQTQKPVEKHFKSNFAKPFQNQKEKANDTTSKIVKDTQTQPTEKQFKSHFAKSSEVKKEETNDNGLSATEVAAGTAVAAAGTGLALKAKSDKVSNTKFTTKKQVKPKSTYKPKPRSTYKAKPKPKPKRKSKPKKSKKKKKR